MTGEDNMKKNRGDKEETHSKWAYSHPACPEVEGCGVWVWISLATPHWLLMMVRTICQKQKVVVLKINFTSTLDICGIKTQVLFHLENKNPPAPWECCLPFPGSAGLVLCGSVKLQFQSLVSTFYLVSFFGGKWTCWLFVRNWISTCVTSVPQKVGYFVPFCFVYSILSFEKCSVFVL